MNKSMTTESRFIAEAAAKECQLMGSHEIDEDHLFLALLVSGGPAAKFLVESGVELTAARASASRRLVDLAGSIGLKFTAPSEVSSGSGNVVPSVAWSARAQTLMRSVRAHDTDMALLEELWDSPTGTTRDIINGCSIPQLDPKMALASYHTETDLEGTYEQIAPVSSKQIKQVLNLEAMKVFDSGVPASFQQNSNGTVSLVMGQRDRERETVFEVIEGNPARVRASAEFKPTALGKLLTKPINSSLRNSLRRKVMLIIQAVK